MLNVQDGEDFGLSDNALPGRLPIPTPKVDQFRGHPLVIVPHPNLVPRSVFATVCGRYLDQISRVGVGHDPISRYQRRLGRILRCACYRGPYRPDAGYPVRRGHMRRPGFWGTAAQG